MSNKKFNLMFRLMLKALKYFVFMICGFILAALISNIIGTEYITIMLFPIVFEFIWRLGIILLCLAGTAVLIESFR